MLSLWTKPSEILSLYPPPQLFSDVAYKARDRDDLIAGIDEFLDEVIVLPPGEWDPKIRIEPPKKVPSADKRLEFYHPPRPLWAICQQHLCEVKPWPGPSFVKELVRQQNKMFPESNPEIRAWCKLKSCLHVSKHQTKRGSLWENTCRLDMYHICFFAVCIFSAGSQCSPWMNWGRWTVQLGEEEACLRTRRCQCNMSSERS